LSPALPAGWSPPSVALAAGWASSPVPPVDASPSAGELAPPALAPELPPGVAPPVLAPWARGGPRAWGGGAGACEAGWAVAATTWKDEWNSCGGPCAGMCLPEQVHTAPYSTLSPTLNAGSRAEKYCVCVRASVRACGALTFTALPPLTR